MSAAIQGIYVALFGRPADPAGLAYWSEVTKNGADLSEMLRVLPGLTEYTDRFAGRTPDEVITEVYQNLFGRDPDAEGLAFFKGQLASGAQSLATIAVNIAQGAQGEDKADVQAKVDAAQLFTASLDTPEEIAAYTGNDAAALAKKFLDTVDKDAPATPETVEKAAGAVVAGQDPTEGGAPNPGGGVVGGDDDETPTNQPGSIVIDGDVEVGKTLTAKVTDQNGVDASTVTYKWFSGDREIIGATDETYVVSADTFGNAISVQASYSDNNGYAEVIQRSTDTTVGVAGSDSVVVFKDGLRVSGHDTIQAALLAADAGSTVLVTEGTYSGGVSIDKADTKLIAMEGATLNGGVEFKAGAQGSTLVGLSIEGKVVGKTTAVLVRANDITIEGASVKTVGDAVTGIETVHNISGLKVLENTVTGFASYGVYLNSNNGSIIEGNTFDGNRYGVMAQDGAVPTVSGNTFSTSSVADIGYWAYRGTNPIDFGTSVSDNIHDGSAPSVRILTTGGHEIRATDGADLIVAYSNGGDDLLYGEDGDDVIVGGLGNDVLHGGAGDDIIWGDDPNVLVRVPTNFGDDTINAGAGTNIIILGVNDDNTKLGGQDTVIHDVNDGATSYIFNFNFGPTVRWDSLTVAGAAGTDVGPDGTNADQTFDILKVTNSSDKSVTISIGQDDSVYTSAISDAGGGDVENFFFDLAGNRVYTGNNANLELVIEVGGSQLVLANSFSKWELGALLDKNETQIRAGDLDLFITELDAAIDGGASARTGLLQLNDALTAKLLGLLEAQGNFDFA